MDEYFLQFLWNFQKFSSPALYLTTGERLTVFKPGYQNHDSGPDFLEAKIKIEELTWSGAIEVYYRSSDWMAHKHSLDEAYKGVILHVVWQHDKDILINGQPIPTLELAPLVAENLPDEYRRYINQPGVILCASRLSQIPQIMTSSMLAKAFSARLKQKGQMVLETHKSCNDSWDETAYRILGKNYGFKTNAEPFEKLTKSLPYKIVQKHTDHPKQVEALIFGMAGFLEDVTTEHGLALRQEFTFLSKKYGLTTLLSRHLWKFSRLRPANFPTVRLAQFCSMIINNKHLFNDLTSKDQPKDVRKMLAWELPYYWKKHYDFGKPSTVHRTMGKDSAENIIINTVAPLLTAYSKYIDDVRFLERAEMLLTKLKPENNTITRTWQDQGIIPENAADSQALIYQYQSLCTQKKCLRCNIGLSILNS